MSVERKNALFNAVVHDNIFVTQKLLELIPFVELDIFFSPSFDISTEEDKPKVDMSHWTSIEQKLFHASSAQILALCRAGREIMEDYRYNRAQYINSMMFPKDVREIINCYGARPLVELKN